MKKIPLRPASGIQTLERTQILPVSRQAAWAFFSSAANLNRITPPSMRFRILTPDIEKPIYNGMTIRYKVSPLLYIPVNWLTLIEEVESGTAFTDYQVEGPFRWWKHVHIFREVPGGVEMTDRLEYKAPFGPLGAIAHKLFVRKRVESIFSYRFQVLKQIFPGGNS